MILDSETSIKLKNYEGQFININKELLDNGSYGYNKALQYKENHKSISEKRIKKEMEIEENTLKLIGWSYVPREEVSCPHCGSSHITRERTTLRKLYDKPYIGNSITVLHVVVRRFQCQNPECKANFSD